MKIYIEKVSGKVGSFFMNNRELLGTIVSAAAVAAIYKSFGIKMAGGFNSPFDPFDIRVRTSVPELANGTVVVSIDQPKSAIESSIYSFYKNALSMNDDYYRNREVDKIVDVIRKSDKSDSVKAYAIEAITGIAEVTKDSYYRSRITGKVNEILNIS